jgi:hypothetical protein
MSYQDTDSRYWHKVLAGVLVGTGFLAVFTVAASVAAAATC